jgi:hypothetical protein
MANQPECLECEKLAAVSEESNKIGAFLDYLRMNGYVLAKWGDTREEYCLEMHLSDVNINHLLAEYYDIDLDKVEKERKSLLKWLREQSND